MGTSYVNAPEGLTAALVGVGPTACEEATAGMGGKAIAFEINVLEVSAGGPISVAIMGVEANVCSCAIPLVVSKAAAKNKM